MLLADILRFKLLLKLPRSMGDLAFDDGFVRDSCLDRRLRSLLDPPPTSFEFALALEGTKFLATLTKLYIHRTQQQ